MAGKNKEIKLLFIGDISTKVGRRIIRDVVPGLKEQEKIDLVIANAENAAGGRGVTREILNELQSYGIDYFTTGEHVWDIAEFRTDLLDESLPLTRPYNYEANIELPGKGWATIDLGSKGKVIVGNFIGQVFMRDPVRNPFWFFDEFYNELKEKFGKELDDIPIVIDFHAEATAEKISFGWYVKDKVAAVFGTHTHVGTVDTRILGREDNEWGCAFVSDVGMCGPRDASLWASFDSIIHNFKYPYKKSFKAEKSGRRVFNSVLVEIENNFAKKISRIDRILS